MNIKGFFTSKLSSSISTKDKLEIESGDNNFFIERKMDNIVKDWDILKFIESNSKSIHMERNTEKKASQDNYEMNIKKIENIKKVLFGK